MTRKTKKQKMLSTERKYFKPAANKTAPISTNHTTSAQRSALTKEEQLTTDSFKSDFQKSFYIIVTILLVEVILYYTNFADALIGK